MRVPVEFVRGTAEVTVWMWPNSGDPLTVRLPLREWAEIERKAERVAGGDVGSVIGQLLDDDLNGNFGA